MKQVLAKQLFNGWAQLSEKQQDMQITGVVTDNRKVEKGNIFVAIKGERTDGHSFIKSALESGAALCVAQHSIDDVDSEKLVIADNTQNAMIKLGECYRSLFNPFVIGVTGSVGKTTTKEFVYSVFSAFGKTLKTEGNQNNELGVPNTLFALDESHKYAVIEMGMDNLGDIEKLTKAAKPNMAVISCIGVSHIQNLKTQENILKAKMEICDGMQSGGILVVNGDDKYLKTAQAPKGIKKVSFAIDDTNADVVAKMKKPSENGERFIIIDKSGEEHEAEIPAIGRHNVYNALSAYTLATRAGLSGKKAADALKNYKTTGMRQNIVQHKGITVIEDCYNANPDSMRAAINTISAFSGTGKKAAVLGDMLELGEISRQSHTEIGVYAAQHNIDLLITYGTEAQYIYHGAMAENKNLKAVHLNTKEDAAQYLANALCHGDAVIFKASRGMKFEEIIQGFYRLTGE